VISVQIYTVVVNTWFLKVRIFVIFVQIYTVVVNTWFLKVRIFVIFVQIYTVVVNRINVTWFLVVATFSLCPYNIGSGCHHHSQLVEFFANIAIVTNFTILLSWLKKSRFIFC
jgi:hypothetical protein